ncbi:hypothetical protein ABIC83_002814 [Roseateles asaccharophilus]|uniref:hypothetical protein n=1 Tax=Roseateles asaccharophilus TaxID=582607 RepID=UPI0038386219
MTDHLTNFVTSDAAAAAANGPEFKGYVPLTGPIFHHLVAALGEQGLDDIDWSENVKPPTSAEAFAREAIFVIANSGMKHTIAQSIFRKSMQALLAGTPVADVFGHKGKASAFETIWRDRETLYQGFLETEDPLTYLRALPHIGPITVMHLGKNLGLNLAKPDRHLEKLAARAGVSTQELCEQLAAETGYRAATIDTILWRACATGALNPDTGEIPTYYIYEALSRPEATA